MCQRCACVFFDVWFKLYHAMAWPSPNPWPTSWLISSAENCMENSGNVRVFTAVVGVVQRMHLGVEETPAVVVSVHRIPNNIEWAHQDKLRGRGWVRRELRRKTRAHIINM